MSDLEPKVFHVGEKDWTPVKQPEGYEGGHGQHKHLTARFYLSAINLLISNF